MKSSLTNSLKAAAGGDDDDESDDIFVLDPTKLTLQDIEVLPIILICSTSLTSSISI